MVDGGNGIIGTQKTYCFVKAGLKVQPQGQIRFLQTAVYFIPYINLIKTLPGNASYKNKLKVNLMGACANKETAIRPRVEVDCSSLSSTSSQDRSNNISGNPFKQTAAPHSTNSTKATLHDLFPLSLPKADQSSKENRPKSLFKEVVSENLSQYPEENESIVHSPVRNFRKQ